MGWGRWLAAGVVALVVVGGIVLYHYPRERTPSAVASAAGGEPAAHHVGGQACAQCHAGEYGAWQGSHHDLAMQEANEQTVLGDFADATFSYAGTTSTFFRRDGKFLVNTDGPDGTLADYEIKYTFGVTPLQQYLIEFPGGRLQALSIAWDTRSKEQGGQRWFHLYPDERITHDDELHWTGAQQNWNTMCADCHSTDLKRNYDEATRSFKTSWSEVNVSCEACHGPGSRHVDWARQSVSASGSGSTDPAKGLTVSFGERRAMVWTMDPQRGIARPSQAHPLHAELEVCAPCHSRRTPIAENFAAGKPFLDHYLPALLTAPLYHADGQQRDEVYIWGSFVQSKMYHQGVTCSDCHEPHGLKLRAQGNEVCAQCHLPARYDAASHHFHKEGGAGAQCTACHMPTTTYIVIDPRHDHSLRVPRPDLSVKLGVPNACTPCHGDKPAQWAADRIEDWYGRPYEGFQRYNLAADGAEATKQFLSLLEDHGQPDIARATAAEALAQMPDPATLAAAREALADDSPLVRHAALATIELLPPEERVQLVAPLLADAVRMVRMEAARVLASVPASALTPGQKASFDRAAEEYVAAQRLLAERPEHRTNLGSFYAQRGRYEEAEAEFRAALTLPPTHVPAWVNFADMRRTQGRDQDAEAILRDGLKTAPDSAPLHHALGLTLVRLQRSGDAVAELAEAARLAPEDPRYAYVYAVALNSTGQLREALDVLAQALTRHPDDREMLLAAATFNRDYGDQTAAIGYAERLRRAAPGDPAAAKLLQELRADAGVSE
ncbi:MAG: Beta-barrel assembly-enhancing protease [Gammaproteobacteria bacterium]|nr:Beta-barrel assembly-enhancing protease [Gammaproteobacteria bacterium]